MSILHSIKPRCVVDFEHMVTGIMESYKDNPDFPLAEEYGTTDEEVRDYVYDKQRILDREEERSKNLVVPGIILVMPVIILSGFGNGVVLLLLGVFIGVVLMLAYFMLMHASDKRRLKKMYDSRIEEYIKAVIGFDEKSV